MTRSPATRRVPLRMTIATLVVSLLVLTVAGTVAIALLMRRQTLRTTTEVIQQGISDRVTERVQGSFAPLLDVLRECAATADRGLLDVDSDEALASWLAERTRFDDRFEMLAFLRPDGGGVGAMRGEDRAVTVLSATPVEGDEPDVNVELRRADGSTKTMPSEGLDLSNLEATPMYELGASSADPRWTLPYRRRIDGTLGRAGVLGYRRGDAVVGVFAVGFGLSFLQDFVRSLDVAQTGRVFFLAPDDGGIRVAPSPADQAALGPVLEAAVAALPGGWTDLGTPGSRTMRVSHAGTVYIVGLSRRQPAGLPVIAHALVVPESELVGYLGRYLLWGLLGVLGLLALATLLAGVLSRRVSQPLRSIAEDLDRVGEFDLAARPAPASRIREVGLLGDATRRMKASLRSFGRYVPQDVVRALVADGHEAELGGEVKTLSLFFSDVKGFTSASEGLPPAVLVDALGDYLDVITTTVQDERGTIDKFIGDGVLAFFNAPLDDPDHATHACRSALVIQKLLDERIPQWVEDGRPAFLTRIGLHVDDVLVGNIGTPDRFGYTVIGDGVNFAARLESLNKAYGTWILASEEMRRAVGDTFVWRAIDRTAVSGRKAGGMVYELLGEGDVEADVLRARDLYEAGLEAYLARSFDEAKRHFDEALAARPGDKAAEVLAARAAEYATSPPPADWDGVYLQTQK